MRKAFLLAMTLTCGMPVCGTFSAIAAPEPLAAGQAVTTITGTVLDESGEPLIGATVAQKSNPSNGASTDIDGKFSLRVAKGTAIVISYIGYRTVEVPAEEGMQVTLQSNDAMLDEVVVVGYGTQRRANLTGAVSTVDVAKVMDSRPATDVAKALQGAVPGLTITTSDGSINGNANLRIRGVGTLSNSQVSNPLIVVDGVPVDDLSFVNPDDIAEISVLKDAASSSIYGTRAAFGVILVTTKSPKAKERVSVKYTNNFAFNQATKLPEYSSVPNQLRALMQSNNRQGVENELFGMYLDKMLPYAEAWEAQNGGPRGYGEMRKFESMDNVGDYYVNEDGTGAMYYANWNVRDILFHTAPANKHDVSLEGTSGKTQYRVSFGYNKREGLLRYNAPEMKRYNVTANLSTEIASWWKAGVRFNFADKVYHGPSYWRNPYTYGWRWGSYFGPYGYMKDDEGNIYECNSAVGYSKSGGTFDDDATDVRMQAWSDFQIFKDLTLHADFTYDVQNYNAHTANLPVT
ncbi:MAG: SusC/RagA family TonB-linked outer membrane protein, partial [Muribaculaceae bacterium]|nr:SusC/RagA family TonB-linked outer membrane protein [Muribaculaceae bacterium]